MPGGHRLGPVGGHIVGEVLIGLLDLDPRRSATPRRHGCRAHALLELLDGTSTPASDGRE